MMVKRRPLLTLAALLTLLLAVAYPSWAWWMTPEPVKAYGRIRLGMTPAEVEAAVGVPPGWQIPFDLNPPSPYLPGQSETRGVPWVDFKELPGSNSDQWIWENHIILVGYSEQGTAVGIYLTETGVGSRDILTRLRSWLGL